MPIQPWTDEEAKKIVTADVEAAARDKTANVDPKIKAADENYVSNPKTRNWDGTKIPRANTKIHLLYEQVNAIVPHIISALFADPDVLDVAPRPGTNVTQAAAVKQLLQFQLDDLSEDGYVSLRSVILQMINDAALYNNGIIEFGWLDQTVSKCVYKRETKPSINVINGVTVFGPPISVVTKNDEEVVVSRFTLRNINLKNFFIDPNTTSYRIQDAGYTYTDEYIDIEELENYRNSDGFNIPPREELELFAKDKSGTDGTSASQFQDAVGGMSSNPQVDQSKDPQKARLRLIRYWQKNRNVWTLKSPKGVQDDRVIYNQINKYGVIPQLNLCYSPRTGKFWGIGLSELLQGDQKLMEELINNRLDQENLSMFPPVRKKRGIQMPQSMFRIAPGRVWEGEDKDFGTVEMPQPNPISFEEVNQVNARVEKKTGASSLSVLGSPTAGGNSASRTATGVATQAAATSVRLMHLVENMEDQVLVPLYSAQLACNQRFLDPAKMLDLGEGVEIDPVDIFNASVRFRVKASTKMRAKFAIQQNFPVLLEMLLNPATLEMLANQQGITLDMQQVMELMCDFVGVPFRALFRKVTPEEMQAKNQPTPDQQLRSQMQTERLEQQTESQVAKEDAALTGKVVDKLLGNEAVQHELTQTKPIEKAKPAAKPAKKGK